MSVSQDRVSGSLQNPRTACCAKALCHPIQKGKAIQPNWGEKVQGHQLCRYRYQVSRSDGRAERSMVALAACIPNQCPMDQRIAIAFPHSACRTSKFSFRLCQQRSLAYRETHCLGKLVLPTQHPQSTNVAPMNRLLVLPQKSHNPNSTLNRGVSSEESVGIAILCRT